MSYKLIYKYEILQKRRIYFNVAEFCFVCFLPFSFYVFCVEIFVQCTHIIRCVKNKKPLQITAEYKEMRSESVVADPPLG